MICIIILVNTAMLTAPTIIIITFYGSLLLLVISYIITSCYHYNDYIIYNSPYQ